MDNMIPCALVTGFLGSGKTTFLKGFAARNISRRIVYLVNEFSPRDVDAALVSESGIKNVVSVPGGSIFCKCLVSEFITQMRMIAERWSDAEGLVIEASGMANPKVITRMLSESGLDAYFSLSSVVAVVDPANFLKLCSTLPNIISQIEAADHVILNKLDKCSPDLTGQAESRIRAINPDAALLKTVRCDAQIKLFAHTKHQPQQGEYAKCRDPNYASFSTTHSFSDEELREFLETHGESIFRVKGWVSGKHVDYSGSGLEIGMQASGSQSGSLVWIVRGDKLETIRNSLQGNLACQLNDLQAP